MCSFPQENAAGEYTPSDQVEIIVEKVLPHAWLHPSC